MGINNKHVGIWWTAVTYTISGAELIWAMYDEDEVYPDLYKSEVDVYKAIAESQIEQLTQFLNDERKIDEVNWEPDSCPVQIEILEDGRIEVWENITNDFQRYIIIKTTLQEWRENR